MPGSARRRVAPAWPALLAGLFALAGVPLGCGDADRLDAPAAVVPELSETLRRTVAAELPDEWASARAELATGDAVHPFFLTPAMALAFRDPWSAMRDAEARGRKLVAAARSGRDGLPDALDVMLATLGKTRGEAAAVPARRGETLEDYADQIEAIFAAAAGQQKIALAAVSAGAREALFHDAAALARGFAHQAIVTRQTRPALASSRNVCGAAFKRYDWTSFSAAASTLLRAIEPDFLAGLQAALAAAPGGAPLLLDRATPYGRIVFAGAAANQHRIDGPVAFLADLAGDDHYTGAIASSFDAGHPNAVLVDFDGNDRYAGDALGTATGRLGVGLLLDRAGDDHYALAEASGGVGLGGIGVLLDEAGDDRYAGGRLTQGAAFGGLGLLFDLAGNDVHTSHGLSLGFGGPAGAGLVLDRAGDDDYQAGGAIPSAFNPSEAPDAAPGDPSYQWRAMAMGAGVGRRMLSQVPADHAYAMAGGVGMLIDAAGDDRYDSDNFSQGCGYYFGHGLKVDAGGHDRHDAARYGHGAGVHYGMGVFLDAEGNDGYGSSGPIHNGGGAFDHSVGLFVDAGPDDDRYEWEQSEALGRADFGAVAVAADLGGDDHYATREHPGRASRTAAALFFDAGGTDDYARAGGAENGATRTDGQGGLILDR